MIKSMSRRMSRRMSSRRPGRGNEGQQADGSCGSGLSHSSAGLGDPTERNPSMRDNLSRHQRQSLYGRVDGGAHLKPALRVGRRLSNIVHHVKKPFQKNRKGLSVKFNERINQVEGVERIQDLEKEWIKDMWFQDDEIADMQRENDVLAESIDAGLEVECTRGLESRTEEGNWLSYKARSDAANAVLDEQDRRKHDVESIRVVYIAVSEKFATEAFDRAQQDAAAIEDFLEETQHELRARENEQKLQEEEDLRSQVIKELRAEGFFDNESSSAAIKDQPVKIAEEPLPEQKISRRQSWFRGRKESDRQQRKSVFNRLRNSFETQETECPKLGSAGMTAIEGSVDSHDFSLPSDADQEQPQLVKHERLMSRRASWFQQRKLTKQNKRQSWFLRARESFEDTPSEAPVQ